jgi:hypothetical protein
MQVVVVSFVLLILLKMTFSLIDTNQIMKIVSVVIQRIFIHNQLVSIIIIFGLSSISSSLLFSSLESRSRHVSLSSEFATEQAKLCTNAAKILEKGNKAQKEFAKTLTKNISKLRRRKLEALGSLTTLADNSRSRKKVKARIEAILEAEEKRIKPIMESWVATYGSSDDNPPRQRTVSFNV